ncbi:hypothetical protein MKW98_029088 [Papaver atlanticum]|uniref:Uncharacterized protein n=1 Tax=Papaver atlanticum TaxID=357466 RepID=A0AAD4S8W8_9MAGN|nr:hypothetical protein MKW98_029088 [Papaver atlanticum]
MTVDYYLRDKRGGYTKEENSWIRYCPGVGSIQNNMPRLSWFIFLMFFLLSSPSTEDDTLPLKAIDFGLSDYVKQVGLASTCIPARLPGGHGPIALISWHNLHEIQR